MTGKTHQVIGISVGLGSFLASAHPVYGPATLAAVLVGSSLGSLLPDIDTATSKIWQTLPYGRVMGEVVDPFLGHRNLTHSLLGAGLIGLGTYYLFVHFPEYWGIDTLVLWRSTLLAYASHLVADMLTVQGIPLFFPWQRSFGIPPQPFDGLRIVTGKWFENLIVFPLVNLVLLGLIWYSWGTIKIILFH